jgi:cellulose synthase/poly-beta-1,6-N-acetylglucosamine synthase-like glycosyltransferase
MRWKKKDVRIKLLVQPVREGKASAINLFLSIAVGNILILESADTIPEPGTLDQIIASFNDSRVGMVGGRPVPVNSKHNFIGFTVHLMWMLHHCIALKSPKLGELVAFRDCIKQIPADTAVDEACIEAKIRDKGLILRYIPEAIVRNKGPENIKDFIKQRRRIAAGHIHLNKTFDYKVSTTDPIKILSIIIKNHTWGIKDTLWTFGAIGLEIIGRTLGYYDFYICKKDHCVWDIACSTKYIEK